MQDKYVQHFNAGMQDGTGLAYNIGHDAMTRDHFISGESETQARTFHFNPCLSSSAFDTYELKALRIPLLIANDFTPGCLWSRCLCLLSRSIVARKDHVTKISIGMINFQLDN